jgi:AbrB family looped-hinge helix DNA binding protein
MKVLPESIMGTSVTSKGQVTIPKKVREHLDIQAGSIVEFEALPDGRVCLVKKTTQRKSVKRVPSRFAAIRGTATVRLTTNEIMALTRGED